MYFSKVTLGSGHWQPQVSIVSLVWQVSHITVAVKMLLAVESSAETG